MDTFFRLKKFIAYQYRAKTKYYIHSPFVYQFYLNVLEGKNEPAFEAIEQLYDELTSDSSLIDVEDMGTATSSQRLVSGIASTAVIKPKYGKVLYRLVKYFQPKTMLETGTSLGVSSSYLALAKPDAKVNTLEGSKNIIEVAKANHSKLGINNVQIIQGNIDNTLSSALIELAPVEFIFLDANHSKTATLQYFDECLKYIGENGIIVLDDIYWSKDMYEAWQTILQHPQVTLTIDLFQMGICFFRKDKLKKENFILRY